MTNNQHGQVPEALIDLIDAYAETRHRCGGIYNAMCTLNSVNGRVDVQMPSGRVVEGANGVILVTAFGRPSEDYANQAAFATAYDLHRNPSMGMTKQNSTGT